MYYIGRVLHCTAGRKQLFQSVSLHCGNDILENDIASFLSCFGNDSTY